MLLAAWYGVALLLLTRFWPYWSGLLCASEASVMLLTMLPAPEPSAPGAPSAS